MEQMQLSLEVICARLTKAGAMAPSSDYDLNPLYLPADAILRDAAVLIPITHNDNGWHVILTKRASTLKHHPGQIAFPGGKVDTTDASKRDAALREAQEEIGLCPNNVDIVGQLPAHQTISFFNVTPFIGVINSDFEPVMEKGEVSEIFSVPLMHLTDITNYIVQQRVWNDAERSYYTIPYGPYYIWGATARMLRNLADVLGDHGAD